MFNKLLSIKLACFFLEIITDILFFCPLMFVFVFMQYLVVTSYINR